MQGEELRKQIGAAAYIECSSKTQQVVMTHVEQFWSVMSWFKYGLLFG